MRRTGPGAPVSEALGTLVEPVRAAGRAVFCEPNCACQDPCGRTRELGIVKQPERPAESQGGLFGDIEVPAKTPANKPPKKPVPRPNIEAAGYVHVALDRPLRTEFTYAVPAELLEACRPGVRVAVPFGARREVGVVVGTASESELDPAKTRAVAQVLDAEPVVDSNLLELTRWIATEYACS